MESELFQGRYRILQELGQGGLGSTFLAEDQQHSPPERCVIKQLTPIDSDPLSHPVVQARFYEAAEQLAQFSHKYDQLPNLYRYGEADGKFYLIQEWIDGATLAEMVIHQGSWSSAMVQELLGEILSVLAVLHDHQIIHQDLKPDNIILRKKDRQPALIDFSSVKAAMFGNLRPQKMGIIGTPGFLAPEQGINRPVLSSDLFSLGLTAIYLLTGQLPQDLPCDPVTGAFLWRHVLPSDQDPIDPDFAAVLDRAIQSQAQERFTDARAMLCALPKPIPKTTVVPPSPPPTALSPDPSPTSPPQEVPTVVASAADAPEQESETVDATISSTGMADWQKALLTGSVVGLFLLGGMIINAQLMRISSSKKVEETVVIQAPPTSPTTSSTGSTSTQVSSKEQTTVVLSYQATCGEKFTDAETWYRVIGEASDLEKIKNNYCGDAFLQPNKTLQIASFLSKNKAQEFIEQLAEVTGSEFQLQEVQKPDPPSTSQPSYSEAKELISDWLGCKNELFSYPYNRSCGREILIGKALHDNIDRNDGEESSVEWLENRGAYYKFSNQEVDSVKNIKILNAQQAIADVVVTESRTLYSSNGRVDYKSSGYDQRLVRYRLRLDGDEWKIEDYGTLRVFWRR